MATTPVLRVPDLVLVSKLETEFSIQPEYTQHTRYVSGNTSNRRKIRKEERWERGKRLGRGCYGDVWLQKCTYGDRRGELRAVKEIGRLKGNNFYRELEAIALFSHEKYEQCFVKSYGWYENDESSFIAMEYFSNGDLQRYLGSPFQEREGQQIISQILEGLHFMHQNGFAHRDMKPANILVKYRGPVWWVKIADFGISKRTTEYFTVLQTQTGTPAFLAPEVSPSGSSESEYTNAVDIWALGIIAFCIFTGNILFIERHVGQRERYVKGTFTFPSEDLETEKISQAGCDVIKSLMAVNPEDRPTAQDCLQTSWLLDISDPTAVETQSRLTTMNKLNVTKDEICNTSDEASAKWNTNTSDGSSEMLEQQNPPWSLMTFEPPTAKVPPTVSRIRATEFQAGPARPRATPLYRSELPSLRQDRNQDTSGKPPIMMQRSPRSPPPPPGYRSGISPPPPGYQWAGIPAARIGQYQDHSRGPPPVVMRPSVSPPPKKKKSEAGGALIGHLAGKPTPVSRKTRNKAEEEKCVVM
ncbi:hypothetical protein VTL71DRAFT_2229 [Oculimacula yallundae]|uniref:Protein kinase domain-containing protein n=1 Tax=Oculimacula yallundae TaxID=86028 RepID=A0ABR4CAK0_9HELO